MNPTQKITTIDDYIASQPNAVKEGLQQIRETILAVAPGATESISYGMPAYSLSGMLVWFAANKTHYGLYPKANAIEVFKDKLIDYGFSKGAIRFPLNKPLPLQLIAEIVQFRVQENLLKAAKTKA